MDFTETDIPPKVRVNMHQEIGAAFGKGFTALGAFLVGIVPFMETGVDFIQTYHFFFGLVIALLGVVMTWRFNNKRLEIYRDEIRRSIERPS